MYLDFQCEHCGSYGAVPARFQSARHWKLEVEVRKRGWKRDADNCDQGEPGKVVHLPLPDGNDRKITIFIAGDEAPTTTAPPKTKTWDLLSSIRDSMCSTNRYPQDDSPDPRFGKQDDFTGKAQDKQCCGASDKSTGASSAGEQFSSDIDATSVFGSDLDALPAFASEKRAQTQEKVVAKEVTLTWQEKVAGLKGNCSFDPDAAHAVRNGTQAKDFTTTQQKVVIRSSSVRTGRTGHDCRFRG